MENRKHWVGLVADRDSEPDAVTSSAQPCGCHTTRTVLLTEMLFSCRSCTSFANWASHTKASLKKDALAKPTSNECPPDVETLGRGSWNLLHSIAAQYPDNPSQVDQENVRQFMNLFATLYPCWVCGEGFAKFQMKHPIPTESRNAFGTWLCDAHNEVNRRLGKPKFDCSKWEERWRTGWKDGRCD